MSLRAISFDILTNDGIIAGHIAPMDKQPPAKGTFVYHYRDGKTYFAQQLIKRGEAWYLNDSNLELYTEILGIYVDELERTRL